MYKMKYRIIRTFLFNFTFLNNLRLGLKTDKKSNLGTQINVKNVYVKQIVKQFEEKIFVAIFRLINQTSVK